MTRKFELPRAEELTNPQHQGWACCWCGRSLWTDRGGVSAGRAQGANGFSIEVYACPDGEGCSVLRTPETPRKES